MGSESSKSNSNSSKSDSESSKSDSNSNSSKSDSDSSSNSANKNRGLETMDCLKENENTIINRVWIVKKSITLYDRHVNAFSLNLFLRLRKLYSKFESDLNLVRPKPNIFKIKNEYNSSCKHWAIILELSNDSYVNIQFGKNGFFLKEYNKTDIKGENVFNSIMGTWGEEECPFSFCYLGNANYKYDKLKITLNEKKNEESKRFKEKGETYYNALFKNCQHFACDIEKILFGEIKGWHSFDFYLDQFYDKFFPNINLEIIKLKYENSLKKENEELFKLNLKNIKEYYTSKMMADKISKRKKQRLEEEELLFKEEIEEWYSLKCDDYLN